MNFEFMQKIHHFSIIKKINETLTWMKRRDLIYKISYSIIIVNLYCFETKGQFSLRTADQSKIRKKMNWVREKFKLNDFPFRKHSLRIISGLKIDKTKWFLYF